jgi:anti-sigma-K factor RskA
VLNPPAVTGQEGGDSVPASYIGVLATPEGKQGLIVASLRHGRTVDLKQVSPMQPPAGQTLFLWTLDAQGQARPVGPIPAGAFVQAPLPDTAEKVFAQAVELGVTLEAVGSQPSAPGGPWVYRGLCGKVWRAPPPAPAAK